MYVRDTQFDVTDKCSVDVTDKPDSVTDMPKQREILSRTSENPVTDTNRTSASEPHRTDVTDIFTPSVTDIFGGSPTEPEPAPRAREYSLYIYYTLKNLLKPFFKYSSALKADEYTKFFGDEYVPEKFGAERMMKAGFGLSFREWVQERLGAAVGRPKLFAELEEVMLAGLRAIEAKAVETERGKEIIRSAYIKLIKFDIDDQVQAMREERQREWSYAPK